MVKEMFPGLNGLHVRLTSPKTATYNCIAWAAGFSDRWWWPNSNYHWPDGVPAVQTEAAFEAAYKTVGFVKCDKKDEDSTDTEWIAVFLRGDFVTHASRQLPNGHWTSKLGNFVDIEHSLHGLEGSKYGKVAFYMKRHKPVVAISTDEASA